MQDRQPILLWLVLAATLGWAIGMWFKGKDSSSWVVPSQTSCSYTSGTVVLDLELASSQKCFEEILSGGDVTEKVRIMRTNTYMDFVFIALYWGVFVLFAATYRGGLSKWVVVLISTTAVLDVLENWRIFGGLRAITTASQTYTSVPRYFSSAKWIVFGFALLALAALLWALRDLWSRVVSATLFSAGFVTMAGLVVSRWMKGVILLFAFALVVALVRYYPFLKRGVQQLATPD